MKTHVAENALKTRRAVAVGRLVQFFSRKQSKEHFVAPKSLWRETFSTHKEAIAAADLWAMQGKLPL